MIKKWKLVSRKIILDHPRARMMEDVVELPDRNMINYIREAPATSATVAIIAIDESDRVLIQREYSYPPDEVMYQLPGGSIENGEDPITAANRELSEESGYTGLDCKIIGSFYLNNRMSDRKQFVVLCRDLKKRSLPKDAAEFIESEWMTKGDLRKMVEGGQINNITLLAGLGILFANEVPNP